MGNISCFLWCTWYNLKYLSLNKDHQTIQDHHSTLVLLVWACFCTAPLYFASVINRKFWEATYLFELVKSNLCGKWRKNLCGSTVSLFYVLMNIISMLFNLTLLARTSKIEYQFHTLSCYQLYQNKYFLTLLLSSAWCRQCTLPLL